MTPTVATNSSPPAERATTALRLLVLGYPRFARRQMAVFQQRGWRCTYIESAFVMHALTRVPFCDAVYQIGIPIVPRSIFEMCRRFGRPVVKHWVGTDVLRATDQAVREQNRIHYIEHWADAPWLADELARAGIAAKVVAVSPIVAVPPLPMPPAPLTVLTYLPDDKYEFYGAQIVYELARLLPEVRFLVLASERRGRPAPDNLDFIGYHEDVHSVYARSHVLVRMPDHDGMSQMILEALNHGRYAIWNYAMEGVLKATTAAEAADHLRTLRDRLAAGTLPPNDVGRDHVRRDFLGSAVADRLCAGIVECVRRSGNGAVHAS
jgi:hypothetical protein